MSSSDDDVPLGQRNQAFLLGKTRPVVLDSSDDDSPLPSWLKNHKSPVEPGGALDTDSDSGIREIISPVKLLTPTKQKSEQEQQREPPAGEIPAPKPASGPKKKPSSAKKAGAGAAVDKSGQGTSSQQPDASQRTGPEPAQPSGRPALPGVGIPAPSSCLPVVLPDKLSQVKLLMELESTDEVHGATDLSGDSGAIGRVMLTGAPGAQQVQVDLKGVLYNATIVPTPVTMAVVNIGQTEAKVECLFNEFVQLREDARFAEAMGGAAFGGLLGEDDDDDHYAVDEGQEDGAAGGSDGKKSKKPGAKGGLAKPKARGTGAKGAATKKPRGGVGKKPAKPKAKPKAKK